MQARPSSSHSAALASRTIEAQRERVCARLREYVTSRSGQPAAAASLIGVKEFRAILREAGIKNASAAPWIHGYAGPGNMGTDFEADCYESPSVLCLVS